MITFTTAFRSYILEWCRPERVNVRRVEAAEKVLVAFFGDCQVTTITRGRGRDYRAARLAAGVVDATVRRELGVLNAVLRHAVKEGRLAATPIFDLPNDSPPREDALTHEEAQKLLGMEMSARARLCLLLGFGSGHRKAAIEGLKVGKVDFARSTIDFRDPAMKQSKKRRAKVPMAAFLVEPLKVACAGKKADDFVLPPGPECGYEIKKLMVALGKPDVAPVHILRHSFVTWALEAGESLERIADVVADTPTTIFRQYAHVRTEKLRSVVENNTFQGATK